MNTAFKALILPLTLAALQIANPLGRGEQAVTNELAVALVLRHVGVERKPIQPVLLYGYESARNFKFAKFGRGKTTPVVEEKCEPALLEKLRTICKSGPDWLQGG